MAIPTNLDIAAVSYNGTPIPLSGGTTPTGTKTISISSNGTSTTDVSAYAYAQVIASVPNSYSAADEGKVVSNGALTAQASATYTSNATYDTTLIDSVTVNVSGGGTDTLTQRLNSTLTSYSYSGTGPIYRDQFRDCKSVTSISMDNVTAIPEYAFAGCDVLASISFNSATSIGNYAFGWDSALGTAHFPAVTSVGSYAFTSSLYTTGITIVLPAATTLSNDAFRAVKIDKIDLGPGVATLSTRCIYGTNANHICNVIILRKSDAIVTLANATSSISFSATAIYVPSSLISSYQADTNWATVLSRGTNSINAIEGSAYENYYADGTAIS